MLAFRRLPFKPRKLFISLCVFLAPLAISVGYYLALYLPDAAGIGLAEKPSSLASYDPAMCSEYYTVVAWPITFGSTGKATFFVNQQGEVLKTDKGLYSGLTNIPKAGCGLVGTDAARIDSQHVATNMTGADGNLWLPVH